MTKKITGATKSREIALEVLMEVLEHGVYSHLALRRALDKYGYLERQDRAMITRLAEGTIERLLTIDAVLGECSKLPPGKMKPMIRTILRMSVYQILWMDRIPDSAVCSQALYLAESHRFHGLKGFVNGVLRNVARRKDSFVFPDWSLAYSMPEWILSMWKKNYDPQTVEAMLRAFLEPSPTCVRCNLALASMEQIRTSLECQGVRVTESPLLSHSLTISGYDTLEGLEAFEQGWIQVQDVSSSLAGEAVEVRKGDVILDLCGAPGGKALHLADKLDGTGMVLVRDLTQQKVELIEENIERAGYSNIRAQVWDARVFDPEWENRADVVIADLPCSGLGIIGRKPDIKYQASEEGILELAALQREILSVAARYVKPGGTLVYSTCTISRLENEEQRTWFLEHAPFESKSMEGRLGSVCEETLQEGYLQLLPGQYPCDGFFIAAFRKKENK